MTDESTTTTATRDPLELLTAEEITALSTTVQRANPGMDQALARRITLESLRFVATSATYDGPALAPSALVDEGWHALILHTRINAKLTMRLGRRVDHLPQAPGTPAVPGILERTQSAMRAAGWDVDTELWLSADSARCTDQACVMLPVEGPSR